MLYKDRKKHNEYMRNRRKPDQNVNPNVNPDYHDLPPTPVPDNGMTIHGCHYSKEDYIKRMRACNVANDTFFHQDPEKRKRLMEVCGQL